MVDGARSEPARDDGGPAPTGIRRWTAAWIAAGLGFLVFAGSLGHGFAYDDTFLLRSPLLAHPWNLAEVFAGGFYGPDDLQLGLYRPLGQWSLVLNAVLARALTGTIESPLSYHLVSLVLHAAVAFLVYAWLARLPLPRFAPGAAAILWAVHPIHAEVAVNVTARYESTCALFGLGFLIAHRSGRGVLAGAFLLAALFCKESALVFLPLAWAVDGLFPVDSRRFRPGIGTPAILAIAVWFGLRALALADQHPSVPFVENPMAPASFFDRLPTAAWVQLLYLRDQALPLWLSTDHSHAQIDLVRSSFDPRSIGFVAILLAGVLAAWRAWRRQRWVAFVVLGYAITFSLACNVLVPIGTAMADRLAYVPSIFPCVLVGALLASVPSRAWRGGLLVIGTGALAVASARQVPQWKDDLSLFERQVVTAPRSAKAHGNLGNALREDGRLEEAATAYDRSIAIFRFRPEAHLGLAQVYELQRRDPELRLATWTDAIRFGTAGNEPWVDEALAWIDLGGWNALEDVLRKQLQVDPGCRFRVHLERILVAARELASVPDPAGGDAWRSGLERLERGDHAGAEATLRTALHRGGVPAAEVPAALEALARCHAGLGRPGRASSFRRLAAAVRGADASAPAPTPAPTQPGGKRGD